MKRKQREVLTKNGSNAFRKTEVMVEEYFSDKGTIPHGELTDGWWILYDRDKGVKHLTQSNAKAKWFEHSVVKGEVDGQVRILFTD